jgi:hypothetical protein
LSIGARIVQSSSKPKSGNVKMLSWENGGQARSESRNFSYEPGNWGQRLGAHHPQDAGGITLPDQTTAILLREHVRLIDKENHRHDLQPDLFDAAATNSAL